MTKRQFFQWLRDEGCEIKPKEGINNTAPPIEVVNKRGDRYSYIALPYYTDDVSDDTIEKLIKDLGLQPPKRF
jgi:hypothetical protein